MSNSFGEYFHITTFGESHGKVIGVVIDGCPSGLEITSSEIQKEMDRRRPGQTDIMTGRFEKDTIEILSGIMLEHTTGAPIAIIIRNLNVDSKVYEKNKYTPRPSHADYPALARYGKWVDINGGGRFSGRITASFVMAGAIAKKLLSRYGIKIAAYARSIGKIVDNNAYSISDIGYILDSTGMVNKNCADKAKELILKVKSEKDSVGGTVTCITENLPPGVGDMVFGSLETKLSGAIFAIPGIRGIEFGLGFSASLLRGSQHNDPYAISKGKIITETNKAGGIVGGISTGMPINFTCAVKPTPTIGIQQKTVDLECLEDVTVVFEGIHDPCIVPRVIPVIESLTAIVLVDELIGNGIIPRKIE
ncbi:MAG: chorismate synthase [Promethearchaeota archaeon]|nr:MAG: chorismate synthase [Candidatus Lokiarchaeota archaeon]